MLYQGPQEKRIRRTLKSRREASPSKRRKRRWNHTNKMGWGIIFGANYHTKLFTREFQAFEHSGLSGPPINIYSGVVYGITNTRLFGFFT